nr:PREDICTED: caspase-14-like [Equus przewalskii]
MGGGRRSGSDGLRWPSKTMPAMEELQSRLQETLDLLSPQELRSFRRILKTVDEEPRVLFLFYSLFVKIHPVIPRKVPKRSYDCVDGELDRYDLSGRRKAFLMCVKRNRPGAQHDVMLMKEWLGQCQFEHTSCIDPDKMELLGKITSFRDGLNEIKDEIGCCLVTLMSHGENGFIKMKDDERVSLEDIFEMFNNKNCPALQEKPKIFIIQACRGEKRDSGVETDDEPMDSDDISEKRRLPTFSDYFIIYPTQADHVALRHPRTGSVMIEAMAEVFKQHGNRWHIADFFTRVNNRVVHTEFHLREEPIKVSLVMESTLTKSVYF